MSVEKSNPQKHALTVDILKALGLASMVAGMIVFPGMAPAIKWMIDVSKSDPRRTRRTFQDLQKRGMLRVKSEGSQVKIILTSKGKKWFRRYRAQTMQIERPKHWDGQWRIVMFDIPEAKRITRDLIRRKLRTLGFVTIQKSVFIHPFACEDIIDTMREYYQLLPGSLYVFDARVKEGEAILLKHFKLS